MKMFTNLLKSEIRKVEKFAQARDKKDSRITGYGYSVIPDKFGFVRVTCEICSNDMQDREDDVVIYVAMFDRRKSFVSEH